MIRPFGLRDSLLVRRLQASGISLDIDHALVHKYSPFWAALRAPVPWHVNGIATYVLRAQVRGYRLQGFVQIRRVPGSGAAWIAFLSPGYGVDETLEIWRRLLRHTYEQAGLNGVQRLYAALGDEYVELLDLFRQLGFSLFAREELYRLRYPVMPDGFEPEHVRPYTDGDGWQVKRLYAQVTPQPVQLAEGAVGGDGKPPFLISVSQPDVNTLVAGRQGEAQGVVQIRSGTEGHLIRLWGDTYDSDLMAGLLLSALRCANPAPVRPVYCVVRDYQGGLRALLEEYGFEYMGRWARLVRHVMRTERVPANATVAALDPRTEAITTATEAELGALMVAWSDAWQPIAPEPEETAEWEPCASPQLIAR